MSHLLAPRQASPLGSLSRSSGMSGPEGKRRGPGGHRIAQFRRALTCPSPAARRLLASSRRRAGHESVLPVPGAYIAVIGPGNDASEAELAAAEEVGRLLARAGATVVCGGLGGVMAAVSKGARSNGGVAVGLLPGREHGAGNAYLTVELPTGQGEQRNAL